jgi:hypothetical protein
MIRRKWAREVTKAKDAAETELSRRAISAQETQSQRAGETRTLWSVRGYVWVAVLRNKGPPLGTGHCGSFLPA